MKFSIRDLLLVTVIVALAVGWWIEHSRVGSAILDAKAAKDRIGRIEEELDSYGLALCWDDGVEPVLFSANGKSHYPIPGGNADELALHNSPAPTPIPPKK